MFDRKIVLFGAGKNTRNFISNKPVDCCIKYIVDSNCKKQGESIQGVEIVDKDMLINEDENLIVLLTFSDCEIESWLDNTKLEWYKMSGRNSKNIFCQNRVIEYIDEELYSRFKWDDRLKNIIHQYDECENFFRDDFYDNRNEKLVNLVRSRNYDDAERVLNDAYSNLEGVSDDEYYDYRPAMRLIKRVLNENVSKNSSICDIGCGNGELITEISRDGYKTYGADISEKRVQNLINKGINAVCAKGEKLPYECNSMDVVCSLECLEHVFNPIEVLNEIKRILRPNGLLFLTVPYQLYCESSMHLRQWDERKIYSLLKDDFYIEKLLLVPYINSFNMDNMFVLAKLK